MRKVKIKQVRRMCSVKGCGNRVTYFISRTGDFAGSVNICAECLDAALGLTKKTVFPTEPTDAEPEKANDAEPEKANTDDAETCGVQTSSAKRRPTKSKQQKNEG